MPVILFTITIENVTLWKGFLHYEGTRFIYRPTLCGDALQHCLKTAGKVRGIEIN